MSPSISQRISPKDSIDKRREWGYNFKCSYGLVAQLGAHHSRIVGVEGSNPFKSTKKKDHPPGGLSFWY